MKRHIFEQYYRKHSHFPRVRIDNSSQRLTVEFHRGYVLIKTTAPFAGEVYITRSAWIRMLKQVLPFTRVWIKHPAPDFDVPQAVHQAYLDELELSRSLREAKKTRYLPTKPLRGESKAAGPDDKATRAKRRRFLAAKRRARRSRPQST